MGRGNRKYIKLIHFIKALKIDKNMSYYLYTKLGVGKNKNEYLYNKYLLMEIKDELYKYKELNNYLKILNITENSEFSINYIKKEKSYRWVYRILDIQYKEFQKTIYKIEDLLYNKYILKGNDNENNTRTKQKGMERTL